MIVSFYIIYTLTLTNILTWHKGSKINIKICKIKKNVKLTLKFSYCYQYLP